MQLEDLEPRSQEDTVSGVPLQTLSVDPSLETMPQSCHAACQPLPLQKKGSKTFRTSMGISENIQPHLQTEAHEPLRKRSNLFTERAGPAVSSFMSLFPAAEGGTSNPSPLAAWTTGVEEKEEALQTLCYTSPDNSDVFHIFFPEKSLSILSSVM
ncbi:hypothetical protein Anapl_08332 [Anas platyrhynchos]|uniref:Uncharacterized protein n=1 Tax=Anas platyrhynchos TaxID=8839 RepID=R0LGE2_ANAPL|nr:hypothetical protein Anapl_08332 [Anas platyrhynchos]